MSRGGNNKGGLPNRGPAPKGTTTPKPVIPKAPQRPASTLSPTGQKIANANRTLDQAEGVRGAHSRSEHVGKTGQQLTSRNKQMSTSFLTKHDQNKAVGQMSTPGAVTRKDASAVNVSGALGKTASIARVSEKVGNKTVVYNAKVTQTTVVTQKNGRIHTAYPSAVTPLPKPAPGPSLKPTTKSNVTSITGGASQLRSVPAPNVKGPSMARDNGKGVQKNFGNVTKGVKK